MFFFQTQGRTASNRLQSLSAGLLLTSAMTSMVAVSPAVAQGGGSSLETVIVTGTAIRGAAPTGSNLITVDRASIEALGVQTVQELLTDVPQVNINFGSAGQAPEGGGGNISGPTIHSLGNQTANATLVLINGHRIAPVGETEEVVDPSIIPASALQRVEVLPDGASSIYGADALAGVINFITRRNFTGWQTTAQHDIASHYEGTNIGQLWGTTWTGGSVMVAYNYSSLSRLNNVDRAYIGARQDIIRGADATATQFIALPAAPPAGSMTTTPASGPGTTGPFSVAIPYPSTGSNFQNFSCPIATIAASSTAAAFTYPYTGTGISTTQTNPSQGVCDTNALGTTLPSQTKNDLLVSVSQAITSDLTFSLDLIYGVQVGATAQTRGTASATVFGPTGTGGALGTAQRNPFYVGNATTGTASQFVRYDFDALLGPGAYTRNEESNLVGVLGFDYELGGDWSANFDVDVSQSQTPSVTVGQVCSGCATLALNGTTNSAGSANTTPATSALIDPQSLGTVASFTRALTTLNALDVWDPAGPTNKTAPNVITTLLNNETYTQATVYLEDYNLKFNGPIPGFDLGAGAVKLAVGTEYRIEKMSRYTQADSTVGGASQLSTFGFNDRRERVSYSAFLEALVPLVTEAENVPLIRNLAVDISGRYDHYSFFGDTENPKVGITWEVFDGIKTHGSYSTSFMAPGINTVTAAVVGGGTASSGGFANGTVVPFNSTKNYSTDLSFSGQGIAGTFVSTAASCAAAGSSPVDVNGNTVAATSAAAVACKTNSTASPGLTVQGGFGRVLGPETGLSYSAGMDVDAGKVVSVLDGLNLSATYYNTKFVGYLTNQTVNATVPSTNILAPIGGWTPTSPFIQQLVATRSLSLVLPPLIWSVVDNSVINAFNLWQEGVDFAINYRYLTDDIGTFTFGLNGNQVIRFAQGRSEDVAVSIVDGANSGRQAGVELTMTGNLGWKMDAFQVQLTAQYAHPFTVINTAFPYNLQQSGTSEPPGTSHVGPLWNANVHFAYDLPENFWGAGNWTAGTNIFLNVQNFLNIPPPYNDSASGSSGGNQIGREYIIGFRKAF